MKTLRTLLAVAALLLLLGGAAPSPALAGPAARLSAVELYELGLKQMRRGNYTRALETFNRVRNYHRDDPVSVQAQLAIAELHFKKREFEQARFAYEEFASLHPRHKDLDLVVFRTGLSIYKRASRFAGRDQAATRAALNTWTGFESRFPESEYVPEVNRFVEKCRERLANKERFVARFYERQEAWRAVKGRSRHLLRTYPGTSSVPEALRMRGTALHAWGEAEEALAVRTRLAEVAPGSRALRKLDRALAEPPGEPPEEDVFVRPYRIRGALPPQAGGAPR